ncbi:gibberellin 2-beta-dioxygenase 3-like [Phragmites australis]|uniref:gibberellin 2-beta-dioxygenase 3-like n=1 Tax=Phragmites australis TaxID=29695 RepID=UPI002D76E8A8|nr:gibberellin 2-beta-dioxygenase 3-like [Phragmites australis]
MVVITAPSSVDQIPLMRCPKDNAGQSAAAIPSVDLSAPGAAAAVADACRSVGFFRATNHGVPAGLADALEARAMAFFALPHQDKLDMSGAARPFGYGSKSIGSNGDVGWLEYLLLSVGSNSVLSSSLPPSLRMALEEYTAALREVGGRVLELMEEELGLDRELLRRMVVGREGSDEMVRVNYYPPCPPAPGDCGVTGFGEHTDPQIISVLRSNCTAGLQIKLRDGRWAPVPPDPESFFVNVGDSLQVLTNGRFRSVKHRVVAPEGTQSRLSVIYFGGPAPSQRIGPLPQVMRDGEQSLYREFTWGEYKRAAYKTRLGDHRLGPFELRAMLPSEPANSADPQHCSGSSCMQQQKQQVAQVY